MSSASNRSPSGLADGPQVDRPEEYRPVALNGGQIGYNQPERMLERKLGTMAYSPQFGAYPQASAATSAVFDAGLRAYMLRVYNWMASGLLLTGAIAYAIANTSLINAFYPLVQTPLG